MSLCTVPCEFLSDRRKMSAHPRPAHALLDGLSAAGAGGDLPIGMKADQLAAAEHRLCLLGGACDQILHQHLVHEGAVCTQTLYIQAWHIQALRLQVLQHAFEVVVIAHKPDAAAGGADGGLDETRK